MKLDYIEDLICKENINLIKNKNLENTKGAFARYGNTKIILYNTETDLEKKCILAEELNHYYYDATYKYNSNKILVDKAEYKAKKYTYKLLVPIEKLKENIKTGLTSIEDLADFFEVSYEFMFNCLNYYKNLCLI